MARPSGALRPLAKRVALWYRTWTNDGTFERILERLQVLLNAEGLMDLGTWFADSTNLRASRAAAGAKRGM